MTKSLYLYTDPFFIKTVSSSEDYVYAYLDDTQKLEEEKIHALLLKFALAEKLITVNEDESISHSLDNNMNSWIWMVNWLNLRGLVNMEIYSKLMNSLQSRNAYPVNEVIGLYTKLGVLFDPILLNTICNRTIQSYKLIPYPTNKDETLVSWDQIHIETPFIWLILLIQTLIQTTAKKIPT